MLEDVLRFFSERSASRLARDALDIFIVYYVCYRALLVLRGTRAMQVGVGLAAVFVLYLVAHQLHLASVLSILGALISSIILVIVVVFQNDIRRGLMRVGSTVRFARTREAAVIDEVVDAATELARHRIGALIAFEQDANLDEFVGANKGRVLDAAVSTELLVSLFIPEGMNKLHDGAVVISNLRIAKAGVFFPLPESRVLDQSFGSRHRAAIGITEETDAVVVVVSEERGTISYCFNGNIAPNLDGPRLRTLLESVFHPKARKNKKKLAAAKPAAVTAPASARPEVETSTTIPISEEITLPVRTDGDVTTRASLEARVSEPEPRSPSQPPPPLRPRPAPENDSGPASKANAKAPDSEPRSQKDGRAPLRNRVSPDSDSGRETPSSSAPPPAPTQTPDDESEPKRVLLTSRGGTPNSNLDGDAHSPESDPNGRQDS
jgi:diadenylate cyclase